MQKQSSRITDNHRKQKKSENSSQTFFCLHLPFFPLCLSPPRSLDLFVFILSCLHKPRYLFPSLNFPHFVSFSPLPESLSLSHQSAPVVLLSRRPGPVPRSAVSVVRRGRGCEQNTLSSPLHTGLRDETNTTTDR